MSRENDKCITCGVMRKDLNEAPWGRFNMETKKIGIQCKPCRENEIKGFIDDFEWSEGDTDYEDVIICPYCGNKHEPDCESECFYNEGEHSFSCTQCNNLFEVFTGVTVDYSTKKQEDESKTQSKNTPST